MLQIIDVALKQGLPLALVVGAVLVLWRHYRQKDEDLNRLYSRFIEHLIADLNKLEGILQGRKSAE